uniref:Uncharacterized protein n=1 Tax=Branchiostoma floridae TaxID=7739 RepID=C3YW98_BRAFL|eukprot:XP_002599415.1 hypothetical protein BRAFLDRAFT_106558 [Branchiostoma floridae]
MATKLGTKVYLLLLFSQLLMPGMDTSNWQSCRKVSVAKCGVGDSGNGDHKYRYDTGAYRYKWTKYPRESSSYKGPFSTVSLSQLLQSCQVCSNIARPIQGGSTQSPLTESRTNIMIVDNDIGELDIEKAEILSQIPCGRYCRLWFVGCNITNIEEGAFAKLPQVSTLVIWRSNVQNLRNGTFAGMEGLNRLLLLENNMTHLEGGCFDGLPRLSELILVDNLIVTLSADTFRGLQLRWLDVSANRISNVAPGTLQAIKSVAHVRAVENKLRSIDAGMFHGLGRLRVLKLEGNRISHIADGAFHSNAELLSLDLAGNRLAYLSGGWFKSLIPLQFTVRGNAIAAIALEGRVLGLAHKIKLDNPPRCTCANDWLYEHGGNMPKFRQRFVSAIRVPPAAGCPDSSLVRNPPESVNPSALPCPAPLVEIVNIERDATYNYTASGNIYWERLPQVSCTFPNDSHHSVNITYDTNTTTHSSLPTGNLTVRVVTDLKAEGWVRCKRPENLLGESGTHSLCSNYMGKSSFTFWLETSEPLSFENTTCTAFLENGSHTTVFMAGERAHSDITTLPPTEISLINTTPFSISTTHLRTDISTTLLSTSASDDGYGDLTWYIVWAAIGVLSAAVALVWGCVSCIRRRLRRKAQDQAHAAVPTRNGNGITACSRWPVQDQGNLDESVIESAISPYAEGDFGDHDSLNESESAISPYAEGDFGDHDNLNESESATSPYAEGDFGDHDNLNESESAISPYAEGDFDDHDNLNESESATSPYAEGGFGDHDNLNESESAISPYAEGDFDDHDNLNESESAISPYAEGDFGDHDNLNESESATSMNASNWQSCRKVPLAKCGVGDSGNVDHTYRYDTGVYRYKWTKYPDESTRYRGPFVTVSLCQHFQSCQVCSNETRPTQGGPTKSPSPESRASIMIVDNDVGELDIEKAELLSQISCGSDCRLWFVGCNITAIEGGAFATLSQVRTLVIWRSNVQTLMRGTFAGMEGLKHLLLLENNLTHLEGGYFDGLPRLSELILVDNQIVTLSPDTFRGLQLRSLDNKLRSIDAGMFHGLGQLQLLNLEGNRISHIAEGAFHSNAKLQSISLAGNRLTFLSGCWFKSFFPPDIIVRGNAIAAIALEGRVLGWVRTIKLDNLPRCTCANDWLYEHGGNMPKFKQRFVSAIRIPPAASCPAWSPMQNPLDSFNPSALPCPAPLVEIVNIECNVAYKYTVVGSVNWEQLPQVSCTSPNGSHYSVNITYDTNTTTHASLPIGNLTVRVVTDLKAEGWVRCKGPENLLKESGNPSLCSNYMGKSSFTFWLETSEPLSFGNTTCTAFSETGSHTTVFMASERAHCDLTILPPTEIIDTTPFSISTTHLRTNISTTPLSTSASDDGYGDLTWYIVWAAIGVLSAAHAAVVVWGCVSCIRRRLRRKAQDQPHAADPTRNVNGITACSRWHVQNQGNLDGSVISPYAEGRFDDHGSLNESKAAISPYAEGGFGDHDSLNESESAISPYAEGGFVEHPDLCRTDSSQSEIAPYRLAKRCAAYTGRARAQTHPVSSRPYGTERPRQAPNSEGASLAAYGRENSINGGKSVGNCYQHPSILPNPCATQSSAYQQNASSAQDSRKAPCYNSPALATDLERTLSSTYNLDDASEVVCDSADSPVANSYESAASPSS